MYKQYFLVKCNINYFQKSLHKNEESNIYIDSNFRYEVLKSQCNSIQILHGTLWGNNQEAHKPNKRIFHICFL